MKYILSIIIAALLISYIVFIRMHSPERVAQKKFSSSEDFKDLRVMHMGNKVKVYGMVDSLKQRYLAEKYLQEVFEGKTIENAIIVNKLEEDDNSLPLNMKTALKSSTQNKNELKKEKKIDKEITNLEKEVDQMRADLEKEINTKNAYLLENDKKSNVKVEKNIEFKNSLTDETEKKINEYSINALKNKDKKIKLNRKIQEESVASKKAKKEVENSIIVIEKTNKLPSEFSKKVDKDKPKYVEVKKNVSKNKSNEGVNLNGIRRKNIGYIWKNLIKDKSIVKTVESFRQNDQLNFMDTKYDKFFAVYLNKKANYNEISNNEKINVNALSKNISKGVARNNIDIRCGDQNHKACKEYLIDLIQTDTSQEKVKTNSEKYFIYIIH